MTLAPEAAACKRILVPLDLNRLSEAKLPVAMAQARAFQAELILLHVAPARASGDTVSSTEAQARTHLDVLASRLQTEGLETRVLLRFGRPAEVILEEIEAQDIDLVILGTTVHHTISQFLLGSVAESIIAGAACPVLLVRSPNVSIGLPSEVRDFSTDAARAGPLAQHDLGLRTVNVPRIVGSVGRAAELDANFKKRRPHREELQRSSRILQLMENGGPMPPVTLYKLGYGYYVLDGNHRVAAARQMGQIDIDALVTEFIPLGDARAAQVTAERRAFERATGLYRIGATMPGSYPRLEELIRLYAEEQGLRDLHEAATQWESTIYAPLAEKIRTGALIQRFPGERTADVFVRAAEYRDEASAEGRQLSWDEALESLQQRPSH